MDCRDFARFSAFLVQPLPNPIEWSGSALLLDINDKPREEGNEVAVGRVVEVGKEELTFHRFRAIDKKSDLRHPASTENTGTCHTSQYLPCWDS